MILEKLERETGVPAAKIEKFVATASHRYKTYKIPKRNGGFRVIDHPTPDLKFLQRWLIRNVLSILPVHSAAMAYRKGKSIADAAKPHARNSYLLKLDFEDFFPSLTRDDVRTLLIQNLSDCESTFTPVDIEVTVDVVCKGNALTIGAPSSPILSNALLFDFDCAIAKASMERSVNYSRYADDLFVSTNTPYCLKEMLEIISNDLGARKSPRLTINKEKTVFTSKKNRRIITGLTLTPEGEISIGRAKKRAVRTMVYLYSQNKLGSKDISFTKGYLAFVNSVEPSFVMSLRRKYGNVIIDKCLSEETTSRKDSGSRPW